MTGLEIRKDVGCMTNTSEVVIWSADVDEATLDTALVRDLPLKLIKLDRLALTRMGLRKISEVQRLGYLVFADAKLAEVPSKIEALTALHLEHAPWMLNIMANSCSTMQMDPKDKKQLEALKRFADMCLAAETLPCAVTVLTSKTPETVAYEYNGRTPIEQVLAYVELLLAAGFTDVVCSAQEAAAIRSESRFDELDLNTPGIRLPGSDTRDQSRVMSPAEALEAAVDRLVIGQDLTSGDLLENYSRIDANINPR
jgi:orotidine-5'-phosphate decarboxylase